MQLKNPKPHGFYCYVVQWGLVYIEKHAMKRQDMAGCIDS